MRKEYDVIIVGAGPAGIFAAMELMDKRGLRILIIDKGKDIDERLADLNENLSTKGPGFGKAILSGWGGAGAFSDGKLTLSMDVGGFLGEYLPEDELDSLIKYTDGIFLSFGAPQTLYGTESDFTIELRHKALKHNLQFIPIPIRHVGTEGCRQILRKMREKISGKMDLLFGKNVIRILTHAGSVTGVLLDDGTEISAPFVILAIGREGSKWLKEEAKRLNITTINNPVDIGIRVEVPAVVLKDITDVVYEGKFIYYSRQFDDKVRTFCMNPYGEVINEYIEGVFTVNGHSYRDRKTENTNFAILVSTQFTAPFNDPISYGRYIAGLANLLSGGVIVQRLGDLIAGRRSTPERISKGIVRPTLSAAVPGDLSFALPYRHLSNIIEMIDALDSIAPGVKSPHTLLYGVEVKFYSVRLKLISEMETEIKNLFAAGDGAGVSRGLIQACISGIIGARGIKRRI